MVELNFVLFMLKGRIAMMTMIVAYENQRGYIFPCHRNDGTLICEVELKFEVQTIWTRTFLFYIESNKQPR